MLSNHFSTLPGFVKQIVQYHYPNSVNTKLIDNFGPLKSEWIWPAGSTGVNLKNVLSQCPWDMQNKGAAAGLPKPN